MSLIEILISIFMISLTVFAIDAVELKSAQLSNTALQEIIATNHANNLQDKFDENH